MKALKKVLALVLCLAMVMSLCAAFALADDEVTVDFPDIYPESALYKISDEEVSAKVEALLKTMTEEEMYSMLGGARSRNSRWGWGTGYLAGVARLGVPVIRMWDGPMGVIGPGTLQTNSPVQELGLGATFDTDIAYLYGEIVATDNRATAANMQLGSQVDISRDVSTGRSRDTFSEEPLVVAKIGGAEAKAYEDNYVAAVLKHYTAYSSYNQNQQQEVDLQTLHEVYLAPFDYILNNNYSHAIMSSYNHVNGFYTSASKYLEITVLRDMWGWDGTSMTDWGGNHEMTVGLGTDLEMGSLSRNSRANVEAAIAEGKITYEEDVKTCVRHTLTCMGALGYLNLVQIDANGYAIADPEPPETIELDYLRENTQERFDLLDANSEKALQTALAAPVLLKNEGSVLPLKKSDSIGIVGIGGERSVTGHYSEASFGYLGGWSGCTKNDRRRL
jgi:beta-glucosidase-like glycosyl hydrolase